MLAGVFASTFVKSALQLGSASAYVSLDTFPWCPLLRCYWFWRDLCHNCEVCANQAGGGEACTGRGYHTALGLRHVLQVTLTSTLTSTLARTLTPTLALTTALDPRAPCSRGSAPCESHSATSCPLPSATRTACPLRTTPSDRPCTTRRWSMSSTRCRYRPTRAHRRSARSVVPAAASAVAAVAASAASVGCKGSTTPRSRRPYPMLTMATLTMAMLTMAMLTMAMLTMAMLTMAMLTMAMLTMAMPA